MTKKDIIFTLLAIAFIGYVLFGINNTSKSPSIQGKIDINAVCQGAMAYMTFPDGASAQKFIDECIEGKYPEVIENFKKQMNLGDGATI